MLKIGKCQRCGKKFGFLNDPTLPKGIVFINKNSNDFLNKHKILCFKCFDDYNKEKMEKLNSEFAEALKNQHVKYIK